MDRDIGARKCYEGSRSQEVVRLEWKQATRADLIFRVELGSSRLGGGYGNSSDAQEQFTRGLRGGVETKVMNMDRFDSEAINSIRCAVPEELSQLATASFTASERGHSCLGATASSFSSPTVAHGTSSSQSDLGRRSPSADIEFKTLHVSSR